jgi:hypothetical protein
LSDFKNRHKKGNNMTKILLALTFAFVAAQAENIVHYDTKTVKKPAITKPNHPGTDLYTK